MLPNQAANPYATQLFVTGPLNLYSQLYLPVRRGQRNLSSGGLLLSTPTSSRPQWWHLNLQAYEAVLDVETFDNLQTAGTLEQTVKGGAAGFALYSGQLGQPAISELGIRGSSISALKVRIQYTEYPTQRRRSLVCDIGSCFDLPIGPTQQIDVDLLAPDPGGYEGRAPNAATDVEQVRFATWVLAMAQPCPDGTLARDIGLRFTQAVTIPDGSEGPINVPLVNDVRKVQVFTDAIDVTPPPAEWVPITAGFMLETTGFEVGVFGFEPGLGHTQSVNVPQNMKAILLRPRGGGALPNTTYQVVQELQL